MDKPVPKEIAEARRELVEAVKAIRYGNPVQAMQRLVAARRAYDAVLGGRSASVYR